MASDLGHGDHHMANDQRPRIGIAFHRVFGVQRVHGAPDHVPKNPIRRIQPFNDVAAMEPLDIIC